MFLALRSDFEVERVTYDFIFGTPVLCIRSTRDASSFRENFRVFEVRHHARDEIFGQPRQKEETLVKTVDELLLLRL